ncbi:MAG: GyrI-like domain-containing protein, partial [Pirellulales bacterium]|nr:GyrI-like domain-containing protein [Pirellulales bacterium]
IDDRVASHRVYVIVHEREARETAKMSQQTFEIEERFIEPQLVAGLRMKGKYSNCGKAFSKIARQVGRYIAGKPLFLCYDGEYRENDADFEPCFPIRKEVASEDLNVRTLPGVRCVTLIHRGPYESLGNSYARAFEYVNEKGYEIDLPSREVYLKGPGMIFKGNPKKYLTEIQLPIKE